MTRPPGWRNGDATVLNTVPTCGFDSRPRHEPPQPHTANLPRSPVYPTPNLTTRQPPSTTPTCGTNLPSIPGIPCGDPAAWHIRWARGTGDSFPAGLACQLHMDQAGQDFAWYDRHPAGPACSRDNATWHPDRCTSPPESSR